MKLTHCDMCREEMSDENPSFADNCVVAGLSFCVRLHVQALAPKYGYEHSDICQPCKRKIMAHLLKSKVDV